ncbi:hypothetical protein BDV12DRAFT_18726 [Aspergillus spectabilis]
MTALPDFDLYEALGVAKDATSAEIKSSHRKLVLKCHPDKIKDESLRSEAQDQFQKVQQAYEVLSDETSRTKYDNKVRLAELKREMRAHGAYSHPSHREYRDGRFYEERVPADARSSNEAFFDEQERFTESPRPTSRKHEDYAPRTRSRPSEEKRKSKAAPSSAHRAAKEARESTKASRADQDKYRTKERRRQASDKQRYPESDSDDSGSDRSEVYFVQVKRPSESKRHHSSKSKPTESSRRSGARRHHDDDDDYSDARDYKHDRQASSAYDYIRRSKETIPAEADRRYRSSHSPARYDSPEPEARPSGRSRRSTRETTRPPTSHHSSFEHLDPPLRRVPEKTVPSMPTHQTYPGLKNPASPRPPHQTARSATNVRSQSRSNRESIRRSETVPMMNLYSDGQPRATKLRSQKPDSGHVSTSPTPELPTFAEASPKPTRTKTREPVIVEPISQPAPSRSSRASSPSRTERRGPSQSSYDSSRRLYREVEMDSHQKEKLRYPREVPRDVQYIRPPYSGHPQTYHEGYPHEEYTRAIPRRQSAYA